MAIGFQHYPQPAAPPATPEPSPKIIACSGDLTGETAEPEAALVRSIPRPFVRLSERRIGRVSLVTYVRGGDGR